MAFSNSNKWRSTIPIANGSVHYRVIQRDCHKWKCYQITLNWVFIDFWGIFRFHILGGLLFKATLNQSRHFWFLWPNFSYMIFFRPWNQLFCQATPTIPPFFGSRQTQFCGNISQFTPISWKTGTEICFEKWKVQPSCLTLYRQHYPAESQGSWIILVINCPKIYWYQQWYSFRLIDCQKVEWKSLKRKGFFDGLDVIDFDQHGKEVCMISGRYLWEPKGYLGY